MLDRVPHCLQSANSSSEFIVTGSLQPSSGHMIYLLQARLFNFWLSSDVPGSIFVPVSMISNNEMLDIVPHCLQSANSSSEFIVTGSLQPSSGHMTNLLQAISFIFWLSSDVSGSIFVPVSMICNNEMLDIVPHCLQSANSSSEFIVTGSLQPSSGHMTNLLQPSSFIFWLSSDVPGSIFVPVSMICNNEMLDIVPHCLQSAYSSSESIVTGSLQPSSGHTTYLLHIDFLTV